MSVENVASRPAISATPLASPLRLRVFSAPVARALCPFAAMFGNTSNAHKGLDYGENPRFRTRRETHTCVYASFTLPQNSQSNSAPETRWEARRSGARICLRSTNKPDRGKRANEREPRADGIPPPEIPSVAGGFFLPDGSSCAKDQVVCSSLREGAIMNSIAASSTAVPSSAAGATPAHPFPAGSFRSTPIAAWSCF